MHRGIGRQLLLPIAIADHGDRIASGGIGIVRADDSAQKCFHAKDVKERPGHEMADRLRRCASLPRASPHTHRCRKAAKGSHALERRVLSLNPFVEVVREHIYGP